MLSMSRIHQYTPAARVVVVHSTINTPSRNPRSRIYIRYHDMIQYIKEGIIPFSHPQLTQHDDMQHRI